MEQDEGRRYKSKKQKPCDACRKRKICCVREPGYDTCAFCRVKSQACQYLSLPNIRALGTSSARNASSAKSQSPRSPQDRERADERSETALDVLPPSRPTKQWISQFVGLSGDQDSFILRHCSFNHLNYYQRDDWACLRVNENAEEATHFTLVPDSHLDARPSYYPKSRIRDVVKEEPSQLIRTFFEAIHTSFPLLDPAHFREGAEPGDLLLAAVFEIANPYYLKRKQVHDMRVLHWIFQVLPCQTKQPTLETVEAGLLFLQRQARYHRAPFTPGLWSEIGSLIGMIHDLGLNIDPSNWAITAEDRNRRIRLWWAAYMQDKWCALGLGRPSYITDEGFSVPLPTADNFTAMNFDDSPTPLTGVRQFIGMAVLTTILSDILATFYSVRSGEKLKAYSSDMLCLLFEQFQKRLRSFHDQYLTPLYNVQDFLDPTGTIFLAYYTVELTLHRAGLRNLPPTELQYHVFREEARAVLAQVVSLLQDMTVRRLRAFWWSQVSNINFALAGGFMLSLLLTSVDDADVEYWTSQIKLYRDLLQSQSVGFHPTKLAAARMRLFSEMDVERQGKNIMFEEMDSSMAFGGDFEIGLSHS